MEKESCPRCTNSEMEQTDKHCKSCGLGIHEMATYEAQEEAYEVEAKVCWYYEFRKDFESTPEQLEELERQLVRVVGETSYEWMWTGGYLPAPSDKSENQATRVETPVSCPRCKNSDMEKQDCFCKQCGFGQIQSVMKPAKIGRFQAEDPGLDGYVWEFKFYEFPKKFEGVNLAESDEIGDLENKMNDAAGEVLRGWLKVMYLCIKDFHAESKSSPTT